MPPVFEFASYQARPHSGPFLIGLVALLVILAVVLGMGGASRLRAWYVLFLVALVPFEAACVIASSTIDAEVATWWYRVGAGVLPFAAVAGTVFQRVLIGVARPLMSTLSLILASVTAAAVWLSPEVIVGVHRVAGDLWFPRLGVWAPLIVVVIVGVTASGFVPLMLAAQRERNRERARQWRRVFWSMLLIAGALVDVGVAAYGRLYPVSWVLVAVGAGLTLHLLVHDDLLRVRAAESSWTWWVGLAGVAVAVMAAVRHRWSEGVPTWIALGGVVAVYYAVHAAFALAALAGREAGTTRRAVDRLREQLVARSAGQPTLGDLERLTSDVTSLAIECDASLVIAGDDRGDGTWTDAQGNALDGNHVPAERVTDALRATPVISTTDVSFWPDPAQRQAFDRLLGAHGANALAALRADDRLVGLMTVRAHGRMPGQAQLRFVADIAPVVASAVARHAQRRTAHQGATLAHARALTDALATPVLETNALLPLSVCGGWRPAAPATQGAHPHGRGLWIHQVRADGSVRVAIGEVTATSLEAAVVVAAVRGAFTAFVTANVEADPRRVLEVLDRVVRATSNGQARMTATVIEFDPRRQALRYASAGHSASLVRRPIAAFVDVKPVAGGGEPLGGHDRCDPSQGELVLAPGDQWVLASESVLAAESGDPWLPRFLQDTGRASVAAGLRDELGARLDALAGGPRAQVDQTWVVLQRPGATT